MEANHVSEVLKYARQVADECGFKIPARINDFSTAIWFVCGQVGPEQGMSWIRLMVAHFVTQGVSCDSDYHAMLEMHPAVPQDVLVWMMHNDQVGLHGAIAGRGDIGAAAIEAIPRKNDDPGVCVTLIENPHFDDALFNRAVKRLQEQAEGSSEIRDAIRQQADRLDAENERWFEQADA